jgi:hypothetical protein
LAALLALGVYDYWFVTSCHWAMTLLTKGFMALTSETMIRYEHLSDYIVYHVLCVSRDVQQEFIQPLAGTCCFCLQVRILK